MKIGWLKICNRYSIYHKIYFNSLNLDIQDILFIFKLVIYVLDRPILDTMYKVHFLFKLDIYHRNKRYPRCPKIIFSLLFFFVCGTSIFLPSLNFFIMKWHFLANLTIRVMWALCHHSVLSIRFAHFNPHLKLRGQLEPKLNFLI